MAAAPKVLRTARALISTFQIDFGSLLSTKDGVAPTMDRLHHLVNARYERFDHGWDKCISIRPVVVASRCNNTTYYDVTLHCVRQRSLSRHPARSRWKYEYQWFTILMDWELVRLRHCDLLNISGWRHHGELHVGHSRSSIIGLVTKLIDRLVSYAAVFLGNSNLVNDANSNIFCKFIRH
jgi:hypothetical protein